MTTHGTSSGSDRLITIPTRIDALAALDGQVDIVFDWMPGVPHRLRIPKARAIALGSDLLALGAAAPPARAPVVAPPATVARFPGPAHAGRSTAPDAAAQRMAPPRARLRRTGLSLQRVVLTWSLCAALLAIGTLLALMTGVSHVAD